MDRRQFIAGSPPGDLSAAILSLDECDLAAILLLKILPPASPLSRHRPIPPQACQPSHAILDTHQPSLSAPLHPVPQLLCSLHTQLPASLPVPSLLQTYITDPGPGLSIAAAARDPCEARAGLEQLKLDGSYQPLTLTPVPQLGRRKHGLGLDTVDAHANLYTIPSETAAASAHDPDTPAQPSCSDPQPPPANLAPSCPHSPSQQPAWHADPGSAAWVGFTAQGRLLLLLAASAPAQAMLSEAGAAAVQGEGALAQQSGGDSLACCPAVRAAFSACPQLSAMVDEACRLATPDGSPVVRDTLLEWGPPSAPQVLTQVSVWRDGSSPSSPSHFLLLRLRAKLALGTSSLPPGIMLPAAPDSHNPPPPPPIMAPAINPAPHLPAAAAAAAAATPLPAAAATTVAAAAASSPPAPLPAPPRVRPTAEPAAQLSSLAAAGFPHLPPASSTSLAHAQHPLPTVNPQVTRALSGNPAPGPAFARYSLPLRGTMAGARGASFNQRSQTLDLHTSGISSSPPAAPQPVLGSLSKRWARRAVSAKNMAKRLGLVLRSTLGLQSGKVAQQQQQEDEGEGEGPRLQQGGHQQQEEHHKGKQQQQQQVEEEQWVEHQRQEERQGGNEEQQGGNLQQVENKVAGEGRLAVWGMPHPAQQLRVTQPMATGTAPGPPRSLPPDRFRPGPGARWPCSDPLPAPDPAFPGPSGFTSPTRSASAAPPSPYPFLPSSPHPSHQAPQSPESLDPSHSSHTSHTSHTSHHHTSDEGEDEEIDALLTCLQRGVPPSSPAPRTPPITTRPCPIPTTRLPTLPAPPHFTDVPASWAAAMRRPGAFLHGRVGSVDATGIMQEKLPPGIRRQQCSSMAPVMFRAGLHQIPAAAAAAVPAPAAWAGVSGLGSHPLHVSSPLLPHPPRLPAQHQHPGRAPCTGTPRTDQQLQQQRQESRRQQLWQGHQQWQGQQQWQQHQQQHQQQQQQQQQHHHQGQQSAATPAATCLAALPSPLPPSLVHDQQQVLRGHAAAQGSGCAVTLLTLASGQVLWQNGAATSLWGDWVRAGLQAGGVAVAEGVLAGQPDWVGCGPGSAVRQQAGAFLRHVFSGDTELLEELWAKVVVCGKVWEGVVQVASSQRQRRSSPGRTTGSGQPRYGTHPPLDLAVQQEVEAPLRPPPPPLPTTGHTTKLQQQQHGPTLPPHLPQASALGMARPPTDPGLLFPPPPLHPHPQPRTRFAASLPLPRCQQATQASPCSSALPPAVGPAGWCPDPDPITQGTLVAAGRASHSSQLHTSTHASSSINIFGPMACSTLGSNSRSSSSRDGRDPASRSTAAAPGSSKQHSRENMVPAPPGAGTVPAAALPPRGSRSSQVGADRTEPGFEPRTSAALLSPTAAAEPEVQHEQLSGADNTDGAPAAAPGPGPDLTPEVGTRTRQSIGVGPRHGPGAMARPGSGLLSGFGSHLQASYGSSAALPPDLLASCGSNLELDFMIGASPTTLSASRPWASPGAHTSVTPPNPAAGKRAPFSPSTFMLATPGGLATPTSRGASHSMHSTAQGSLLSPSHEQRPSSPSHTQRGSPGHSPSQGRPPSQGRNTYHSQSHSQGLSPLSGLQANRTHSHSQCYSQAYLVAGAGPKPGLTGPSGLSSSQSQSQIQGFQPLDSMAASREHSHSQVGLESSLGRTQSAAASSFQRNSSVSPEMSASMRAMSMFARINASTGSCGWGLVGRAERMSAGGQSTLSNQSGWRRDSNRLSGGPDQAPHGKCGVGRPEPTVPVSGAVPGTVQATHPAKHTSQALPALTPEQHFMLDRPSPLLPRLVADTQPHRARGSSSSTPLGARGSGGGTYAGQLVRLAPQRTSGSSMQPSSQLLDSDPDAFPNHSYSNAAVEAGWLDSSCGGQGCGGAAAEVGSQQDPQGGTEGVVGRGREHEGREGEGHGDARKVLWEGGKEGEEGEEGEEREEREEGEGGTEEEEREEGESGREGEGEEPTSWYLLSGCPATDPITGEACLVLSGTDVSWARRAELALRQALGREHSLLEEIFPRHVLEAMTAGPPMGPRPPSSPQLQLHPASSLTHLHAHSLPLPSLPAPLPTHTMQQQTRLHPAMPNQGAWFDSRDLHTSGSGPAIPARSGTNTTNTTTGSLAASLLHAKVALDFPRTLGAYNHPAPSPDPVDPDPDPDTDTVSVADLHPDPPQHLELTPPDVEAGRGSHQTDTRLPHHTTPEALPTSHTSLPAAQAQQAQHPLPLPASPGATAFITAAGAPSPPANTEAGVGHDLPLAPRPTSAPPAAALLHPAAPAQHTAPNCPVVPAAAPQHPTLPSSFSPASSQAFYAGSMEPAVSYLPDPPGSLHSLADRAPSTQLPFRMPDFAREGPDGCTSPALHEVAGSTAHAAHASTAPPPASLSPPASTPGGSTAALLPGTCPTPRPRPSHPHVDLTPEVTPSYSHLPDAHTSNPPAPTLSTPFAGPAGQGQVEVLSSCQEAAEWEGGSRALLDQHQLMARYHPEVTIMFADLVSFTSMCSVLGAPVVMSFLNTLFCAFDDLCDKHGVYKVETVGDGFVVAGGLMGVDQDGFRSVNQHTDPLHACKVFALARDMLRVAAATPLPHTGAPVGLRVGLHCGPCTSGVIGRKMPRFCLFGDTMNVASRMETTCSVGSIHLSQAAYTCLQQQQRTHLHALRCQPELQAVALALELEQGSLQEGWEPTGGLEVKGKGLMQTWRWRPPSPAAQ